MDLITHNTDSVSLAKGILSVAVSQLSRQSEFNWNLPQGWLNDIVRKCEYPFNAISGCFRLTISGAPDRLHLQGAINFVGETVCATCLSKLKLDLCAHIDTFMQPAEEADNSQDELTPEDLDIEYYTGNTLELDELVGDSILLELPMIPRCETACRKTEYLVTAAELEQKEKTVDPRLRALADIKLSKEN